jgi:hypothetical protein
LEEWLNPDSDNGTSTDARPASTEAPKKVEAAPAGVNKVDDVSAAFDELFNE